MNDLIKKSAFFHSLVMILSYQIIVFFAFHVALQTEKTPKGFRIHRGWSSGTPSIVSAGRPWKASSWLGERGRWDVGDGVFVGVLCGVLERFLGQFLYGAFCVLLFFICFPKKVELREERIRHVECLGPGK